MQTKDISQEIPRRFDGSGPSLWVSKIPFLLLGSQDLSLSVIDSPSKMCPVFSQKPAQASDHHLNLWRLVPSAKDFCHVKMETLSFLRIHCCSLLAMLRLPAKLRALPPLAMPPTPAALIILVALFSGHATEKGPRSSTHPFIENY